LKVTVCELVNDAIQFKSDWNELVSHVKHEKSQLVLLPEMTFFPWPFTTPNFNEWVWKEAVDAQNQWQSRLDELLPAIVMGTRPVETAERLNEGFIVSPESGYRRAHTKYYLPDEDRFWEASWYSRGDGRFEPLSVGAGKMMVGFLICTELWATWEAHSYGKAGTQIIVTPRCTERKTVDKWLAGGRTCAVVSGSFSLSSNRVSRNNDGVDLGGQGWIIGPDGDVLGLTSESEPFVSVEINLKEAEDAKKTYPRYSLKS